MGIVLRKLIYNETDIHLVTWNGSPCFIVSELSNALDGVNKEDISLFLRHNVESVKGVDYDVLQDADSRKLRSCLEECGVVKRFAKVMVIYFSGLRKYFDFRRTVPIKDFSNYLAKNKVDINETTVNDVSVHNIEVKLPDTDSQVPKAASAAVQKYAKDNADSYKGYSEFLRHIAFMEEFVNSINSLNVSPDKSVAFTVDMTKFLEDNGLQPHKLLAQIKKWIV